MEENHQDPIHSLNAPYSRNQEEIRIVMSSIQENIRKLYEATKKGCIESLKTLMEDDPYLVQKLLISSSNNENPLLHLSISHGHLEVTRLLLHHHPQLASEVDSFQRTPLHLASKLGNIEIVEALLEKNTSACLVYDKDGLIPLHHAVIFEQMDIMQVLINARPQSLWMKLHNGQTILHLCVESNHLVGIKLLIETFMHRDEAFLNVADEKGNNVLDLSIMLRQSEIVAYLLSIAEVKTRIGIADFTTSNADQEISKFQKTKVRKNKRQTQESTITLSTKKTTRRWKLWKKKLKYKGDWIQEVQGTMMLVATVIATVAFEAGVNPPGGLWQQDTKFISSNIIVPYYGKLYNDLRNDTIFPAGTSIMLYQQHVNYMIYIMTITISFFASVSVILLIISRFPLKNRVCSWVLVLAMCVAVVFLALGYLQGVIMVTLYVAEDVPTETGYLLAFYFWLGLVGFVGLFHVVRLLLWVFKSLFCTLTSKLKSYCFKQITPSRYTQLGSFPT